MSLHEFKDIREQFQLTEWELSDLARDAWTPIRGFLNAHNARRKEIIVPGKDIVIDECMSMWEGLDFRHSIRGMPHITCIPRKPRPRGMEIKALYDVESGVSLRLEISEGKSSNKAKQYADKYPHHVALVLRLVNDFFRTWRCLHGDSAFASYQLCAALLLYGIYFGGIVKQATKSYPMDYFKEWATKTKPKRGEFTVLSTAAIIQKQGDPNVRLPYPVLAIGWKDKTYLHFISTFGTTVAGAGFDRRRTGKTEDVNGNIIDKHYYKHVNCPQVVNDIYKGFGVVDIGDHYRQGILTPEEVWVTRTAWHRSFTTIFGSDVCDAYFFYLLDYRRITGTDDGAIPFMKWVARLARQLINWEENHAEDVSAGRNLRRSTRDATEKQEERNHKV